MAADGVTEIQNAEYIYRGHQAIERDLVSVGANIIRIDE
jgi:UDP-N-acetylglucosamine enolpyruvyl transferase